MAKKLQSQSISPDHLDNPDQLGQQYKTSFIKDHFHCWSLLDEVLLVYASLPDHGKTSG